MSAIRVAIAGGGISGCALAAALGPLNHLDVHLYEAAETFTERGAQVGIALNGLNAMQLMGVDQAIHRAGACANRGNRFIIGSGPDAGQIALAREADEDGIYEMTVHRAALLHELLEYIPVHRRHTGKRVRLIEEHPSFVTLHFEDGTSVETDLLIGADGIHGPIRSHILGKDSPTTHPVYSGYWDVRCVHPYERVAEALGTGFMDPNDTRQHDYIGDGLVLIHDLIDDGASVGMVFAVNSKEWPARNCWNQPLQREEVENLFKGWPKCHAIVNLFCEQAEPTKFAEMIHLDAPTYVSERVAILGDAAHAMSPFQASGATQALEDALILATLLQSMKDPGEVPAVLAAYDAVRRPRSQEVAASSLKTAEIATGKDPDIGLNPEKLALSLKHRWDFIVRFSLESHRQEALKLFRQQS